MDSRQPHHHHRRHHGQISAGDRLSAESLPVIDARLLSQSDLLSLSLCSPLSSSSFSSASLAASAGADDDLTPVIDRSVFNESAGSRKQTFLRLRLARHPPPPRPPSPRRELDESFLQENSQVVSLLRSLFSVDSFPGKRKVNEEGEEDFEENEREDNEGQRLFPVPINFFSNVYQNLNLDSVQSILVQVISGNETRRKRGRPLKVTNPSDRAIDIERSGKIEALDIFPRAEAFPLSIASNTRETSFAEKPSNDLGSEWSNGTSGSFRDPNSNTTSGMQAKKKRGRPPKNTYSLDAVTVSRENEDNELLHLQNRDSDIVDLLALANAEDPYEEELRRRTMGLQTKPELLGYLARLRGEWVNAGKKKKVVEASDFGVMLPRGWKLMLCVKKKAGNVWLACRRYVSPKGQQFASWKEVSEYLCSFLEAQGKSQPNAIQPDDRALVPHGMSHETLNHCGSVDWPVAGTEMKQTQKNRVFEHVEGAEEDVVDPVKANLVDMHNAMLDLVDEDVHKTRDRANGDGMLIDFLGREEHTVDLVNKDNDVADLVALSNSEALYGEKLRKMTQGMATTEELQIQSPNQISGCSNLVST